MMLGTILVKFFKKLVMNKTLLTFAIAVLCSTNIFGQTESFYKNAVGVRLGNNVPTVKSGITYKHFLANNNAIEGILSFGDGTSICALYEIHKPINAVENLQWFIGAGGYVGFNNSSSNLGAAGIVGLDYKFANVPLNISLDWKPELNIISKVGFEASGVGFSARFTF
jgi:hypothetical protein